MTAVVLLSGGMDSCVALFWALHTSSQPVDALFVDYGQIARDHEWVAARAVWDKAHSNFAQVRNLKSHKLDMFSTASIVGGAPVDHYQSVHDAVRHTAEDKSYIPIRNALLVTLAAQYLLQNDPGGGAVIVGIRGRSDGPGGFPDCTAAFARAMGDALSQASAQRIKVLDPLNHHAPSRSKTIQMAKRLPGCMAALAHTVSCFHGTNCGECLPCLRRKQAFEEVGLKDPALNREPTVDVLHAMRTGKPL